MLGSTYSLTCNIAGAERLTDAMVAYQWFKNGVMVPDHMLRNLSFSSLTFSDAGVYACQAIIMSNLLRGHVVANTSVEIALICKAV